MNTISKGIVIDLFRKNERISLIKEYRRLTNSNLSTAKDAIEANYTEDLIVALFAPYEHDYNHQKELIIKGIMTACNVWKDMGFVNVFDACQTVLNNLKKE